MSDYKTGIVQIGTFDDPIDWDGGGGDTFVWTHNLGKYPLSVSLFSARAGNQGQPILRDFAVTSTLDSIQVEKPSSALPVDTAVICLITFEIATPQNAGQVPLSDIVQS
jgi:hypothetical protein